MYKIGSTFGKLTVVRIEPRGKNSVLLASCACGKERIFWKKSAIKNVQSCGCGIDDFGVTKEQRRSWNFRFQSYKSGAKKRGYSWELSFQDFVALAGKDCTFCGLEAKEWECFSNAPSVRKDSPKANSYKYIIKISGIDRLDNTLGYTKENSVPCCIYCNRAKSDLSYEDFKNHIEKIHTWLSQNHKNNV